MYIFSVIDATTVIVDYIGIFKARATEDIISLDCKEGYQDEFNFLLKANRNIIIWSPDPRLEEFRLEVRPNDPFEPHKHPFIVNSPIAKDEVFEWISFSHYTLIPPTKEAIDQVREKHWWGSQYAQFKFYDNVQNVEDAYTFHTFAPAWLHTYYSSSAHLGSNLDNKPLSNKQLESKGIHIQNKVATLHPKQLLTHYIPETISIFDYLHHEYVESETTVTVDTYTSDMLDIALAFGFLMPERKVWEMQSCVV